MKHISVFKLLILLSFFFVSVSCNTVVGTTKGIAKDVNALYEYTKKSVTDS